MCGICGIINFKKQPIEKALIRKMMQMMKHRGPDDEGIFIKDNVALGHVRLSIIDLSSAGHQPMLSNDGRYLITFNGEIFNYQELRGELNSKGYNFKTRTDTEVLLNCYIEWGEECLNKLNGMWAFAIYDNLKKTILISRDRYGIKPLYYLTENNRIYFASEILPILKVTNYKSSPNFQAIHDYIVYNRTDQTEDTFFCGIKKLQHGHNLKIDSAGFKISRWYNLSSKVYDGDVSFEEYHELLKSSVSLRMISDVPVGVCLSGGLDSSSIVSILDRDLGLNETHTFSAVYGDGKLGDESRFINIFRKNIPNMHFVYPNAGTLMSDLLDFIKSHSEPVNTTSQYAQYKVMEYAKNYVTVTLDGQGADEILGGYEYFYGYNFKGMLISGNIGNLISEIFYYLKVNLQIYGLYGIYTLLFLLLPEHLKRYIRYSNAKIVNKDLSKEYSKNNSISNTLYKSRNLREALLDHFEYKLEHLLKWEDRNSMAHSIEARVPFLDHRLVEKTISLHHSLLINKGVTKFILRESMKNVLPQEIYQRKDKVGFDTPEAEWFREPEFIKLLFQIIHEGKINDHGIIDKNKSAEMLRQHIQKKNDNSRELWKILNIEFWIIEFFL